LVTAGKDKYKMSDPVEKRRSAPTLPAATAGTVEAARRAANNTIANIINLAATGSQPVDTKMDCDVPAIPGTSRGTAGRAAGGANAPDPVIADTAAGGSGIQQAGTSGTNAAYKNLRQGASASSSKKTVMYEEIMVQRRIRGEHAALGLGPGADMFDCGSFFSMEDDFRYQRACIRENKNDLIVSSTSFTREDWVCTSCDKGHALLPLRYEKDLWEGGRKLFFLTDQNMPAVLPSKKEMCPIIIRIDGGLLRELGTTFLGMLGRYAVPEGSVVVIGSISHLMEEGRVGYSKGLVTEYIRFSKAFNNTVHVVPFVPPPLCGTDDQELMRSMLDMARWVERLQKWELNDYLSELKLHILTTGEGAELKEMVTSRHKMPKAFDAYNDRVYMCHGWDGLQQSLPPMSERAEKALISALMLDLSSSFKWKLDAEPSLDRNLSSLPANSAKLSADSVGLVIGGSNAKRLVAAITDMGKRVNSITCGGWTITKESVDALIPVLQAKLAELDPSVPVILWCLDSACFRALSSDGDLKNISKSGTDGKYHVTGELMVTPFSLLSNTLREIDRIIRVCKDHEVWLMEIVPRFLLKACCEEALHCLNVRGNGSEAIDAARKILDDLSSLNDRIGDYMSGNAAKMVPTIGLLTGVPAATAEVQMDGLYEFWSSDPVHGDKIAYSKIALGLLDMLDRKLPDGDLRFNLSTRKRGRDASNDRVSGNRSDRDLPHHSRSDRDPPGSSRSDRDSSASRSSRSDRDPARYGNSYRTYPGDFAPSRDRFRRLSGPGPRRDF